MTTLASLVSDAPNYDITYSLIGNARVVIYDCNMFIIQAINEHHFDE